MDYLFLKIWVKILAKMLLVNTIRSFSVMLKNPLLCMQLKLLQMQFKLLGKKQFKKQQRQLVISLVKKLDTKLQQLFTKCFKICVRTAKFKTTMLKDVVPRQVDEKGKDVIFKNC